MPGHPIQTPSKLDDPADWVDCHGDDLMRYACARVGRREIAEDLVQDTFLAAYKSRHDFDHRSALGTWLVGILRRKIADHYRAAARMSEQTDSDGAMKAELFDAKGKWRSSPGVWKKTPEHSVVESEFWQVVGDCLDGLPVHLAQAFEMRELAQLSIEEVSEATGVTRKNLAVRLHRARLLLRHCLERRWFGAEAGAST